MISFSVATVGLASALALVGVGGALYEFSVVDPSWPRRPDLIQPGRGGISRRRFWIPAHIAFELALVMALVSNWHQPDVRFWLLAGLASHTVMRLWSAFDFIPKALAFERVDAAGFDEKAALSWSLRSRLRLPLDLITSGAILAALATALSTA